VTRSTSSPGRPTLLVFTRGAAGERRRRRLLPAPLAGVEEDPYRAGLAAALAPARRRTPLAEPAVPRDRRRRGALEIARPAA